MFKRTGKVSVRASAAGSSIKPRVSRTPCERLETRLLMHADRSLGGFVYCDANNDGIKQAGEDGIPAVVITLTGVNDLQQQISLTTQTSDDGSYLFTGLRPGTYAVTEKQPKGMPEGKTTAGVLNGVVTLNKISQIVIPAPETF